MEMTASIAIRPLAEQSDAEWCARLMSTSEPWLTLGRTFDASLRLIQDPSREVYLAEEGEQPVGFIMLTMAGAFIGYIQAICVAPDRRGQGVGSTLVAYAESRIFEASPNVFLCVSSFNPDARRLYERSGYHFVGELRDYVVAGHSELLFRKTRGPWSEFVPPQSSQRRQR